MDFIKSTDNMWCMKLAKFITEQFRNDFIAKKVPIEYDMLTKHMCIIHWDQDQNPLSHPTKFTG
jgi:hypothetical protein